MNDPLDPVINIHEVEDTEGYFSWEVRVALRIKRHGGKLIASCPTQKLAELVRDGIGFVILEDGLDLDVEFEVIKPKPIPTTKPITVLVDNIDTVFPGGWTTPHDERNPE